MKLTISIEIEPTDGVAVAKRLIDAVTSYQDGTLNPPADSQADSMREKANQFALHLKPGIAEKLVRFAVQKKGEFYTDELAAELGLKSSPKTSTFLGHMTALLIKVGELERRGDRDWYDKVGQNGKTYLRIRPSILALFEAALRLKDAK